MKTTISRAERKARAKRLVGPVIEALGLTRAEGARRLGVTYRTLTEWRSTAPESGQPAGRRLLLVEKFLSRAQATLKRRGLVKKSLEEIL